MEVQILQGLVTLRRSWYRARNYISFSLYRCLLFGGERGYVLRIIRDLRDGFWCPMPLNNFVRAQKTRSHGSAKRLSNYTSTPRRNRTSFPTPHIKYKRLKQRFSTTGRYQSVIPLYLVLLVCWISHAAVRASSKSSQQFTPSLPPDTKPRNCFNQIPVTLPRPQWHA